MTASEIFLTLEFMLHQPQETDSGRWSWLFARLVAGQTLTMANLTFEEISRISTFLATHHLAIQEANAILAEKRDHHPEELLPLL